MTINIAIDVNNQIYYFYKHAINYGVYSITGIASLIGIPIIYSKV